MPFDSGNVFYIPALANIKNLTSPKFIKNVENCRALIFTSFTISVCYTIVHPATILKDFKGPSRLLFLFINTCRGDWPKMDFYDNTDHPCYLGPWWSEEIMGNRGYLWDIFMHSTEVSEPKIIFLDIRPNYLEKSYKKYFSNSHPNLEKHP